MKLNWKYRWFIFVLLSIGLQLACSSPGKKTNHSLGRSSFNDSITGDSTSFVCIIDTPFCTDAGCIGTYKGVEFIHPDFIEKFGLNGTDVAHQYSNKMCDYVGKKLKELYQAGLYSKVDFSKIKMRTIGMSEGKNYVEYRLEIPFKRVPKDQATTAFDHSGGWGHKPEIKKRKFDLLNSSNKIVKNRKLWVSKLFKTKEGLEEYWIQWQHTDYQ